VLLATSSQLAAAAALVELDGVARRIVLLPPGVGPEHLDHVKQTAEIDCVVSDNLVDNSGDNSHDSPTACVACGTSLRPANLRDDPHIETEWVLLTSGTTGAPKLVVHTLATLAASTGARAAEDSVWSTFYDIRRFGGLQVYLRAILSGCSLVLSGQAEPIAEFLERAASRGITHISGTPSHWRCALMSPAAAAISPQVIRLSGEIADQAIMNRLQAEYPQAHVTHAFATTEAGVGFVVNDALAGFSAAELSANSAVEMKVEANSLRVRSPRTASRYLEDSAPALKDADGFVDTRDRLELRDGRYYFLGRDDGVINVGGLKVYPEEVEAVLHRHPDVLMAMAWGRKSPITGSLVVAEIVPRDSRRGEEHAALVVDILAFCKGRLPAHKVPATIKVSAALPIAESGKLSRRHA
jgi:acyl-coenzyme A synthetase/AMP-(fatty) acid ligase